MRKILISAACSTALFVGGCAERLANDINTVTGALTSPQAQQAAANAKALNLAITCSLASLDSAVVTVNDAVLGQVAASPALAAKINSKQAVAAQVVNGTVQVAYVANATACKLLGGVPAAAPTSGGGGGTPTAGGGTGSPS